jgi:hypothetical protein
MHRKNAIEQQLTTSDVDDSIASTKHEECAEVDN